MINVLSSHSGADHMSQTREERGTAALISKQLWQASPELWKHKDPPERSDALAFIND